MSQAPTSIDAIERIEGRIAYLEVANGELSDVIYRQQQELDRLRAQLAALSARLEDAAMTPGDDSLEPQKPPHY